MNKNAFSTVELLVTVAISGILAALIFPSVRQVMSVEKQAQCLSNMRQISLSMFAYANDNEQRLPVTKSPPLDVTLMPYLDREYKGASSLTTAMSVWKCPADPRPLVMNQSSGKFARSYAFNPLDTQVVNEGTIPDYGVLGETVSRRMNQITKPQDTILMLEWFFGGGVSNVQYQSGYLLFSFWTEAGIPKNNGQYTHGKKMNFSFCDGHVESMDPLKAIQGNPNMWKAVRQ